MRFVRVAATVLLAPPLFLGAAVCAGAAVAAHYGRKDLEFDILAHFAPLWLAGALLAIAAGFAFRGYARALILAMGGVGVLAAAALIAPELVRDTGPRAAADAPGQIKVVQLNAWIRNTRPEKTLDWLFAQEADVVILQETSPELRRLIARQDGWRVTCLKCEVTILSRRAPERTPRDRGPITRAVFRDELGTYSVIGVHYAWPTDPEKQQAQERRLARVLEATPGDRTIVAGDLNSAPWSFSRRRWDERFGVIRRDRALFSWPALQYKRLRWLGLFPLLPIDHVYAGPGWATVKVERGPRLGSDHYPIVMTLAPVEPR